MDSCPLPTALLPSTARLTARYGPCEALTAAGQELREEIERDTDRANREVVERLDGRAEELFSLLRPWARGIVEGGGYPADPKNLRVKG